MEQALFELLLAYREDPEHIKQTVIFPMAIATIAFTGGILIGAIFS